MSNFTAILPWSSHKMKFIQVMYPFIKQLLGIYYAPGMIVGIRGY